MPWKIPNLLLHDKLVPLANMRSHGRNHAFVYCSNPACHHNAELDVSGFPDDVTFGHLQPRMLCTVCDHRGADVGPSWLHHDLTGPGTSRTRSPSPMFADSSPYRPQAITLPNFPKAIHEAREWQAAIEALILVVKLGGPTMFARIGVMRALNRHVEHVFDPSRKEGRQTLARDQ